MGTRLLSGLQSALLLVVAGAAAVASDEMTDAPTLAAAEDVLFASPTRTDHIGRIVVPVMIDGKGPFRFIVDTAANRSTVSPHLAAALGLSAEDESLMLVNGITGTAQVPSALIEKLQAGDWALEHTRLPVVWAPLMAGADGILGAAGLRNESIFVDFTRNLVTIARARNSRVPQGFNIIPMRVLESGLVVVVAHVGGVRVQAIIDTGSERTIGNTALHDAMHRHRERGVLARLTSVYGATSEVVTGELDVAPTISIASVKLANVTVVFGDFHIFDVWAMQDKPAIIIGMDVLGTVSALGIDFRRGEVYVNSRYKDSSGSVLSVFR